MGSAHFTFVGWTRIHNASPGCSSLVWVGLLWRIFLVGLSSYFGNFLAIALLTVQCDPNRKALSAQRLVQGHRIR